MAIISERMLNDMVIFKHLSKRFGALRMVLLTI